MRATPTPGTTLSRGAFAGLALVLVVAVVLAFGGALSNAAFLVDDPEYVFAEPRVLAGFTAEGLRFAFTGPHGGNWHPLTTLSHMLDVELFGAEPAGHHAVNVGLHALSAVLAFAALARLTRSTWIGFATALAFAVHPLRVESVAWIAERKDVLSGVFFWLTLLAYARWAERPGAGRMAVCALVFAFGLMAKPMLVTLPCVLLLLDVWPLARVPRGFTWKAAFVEKLPLFGLALASCVITYAVQRSGGAMITASSIPLGERVINAFVSVAIYLRQIVWPVDLAPYYPFEIGGDIVLPLACAAGIAGISVPALMQRARRPWIAVGWFWFLGMLVPVIGLVQVGGQSHADRYTYLPSVGILLALVVAAREAILARPSSRAPLVAAFSVAMIACIATSRAQTARWKDPAVMAEHMLEATGERNAFAHQILAQAVMKTDPARARQHLLAALAVVPNLPGAHGSLGILLANEGRFTESAAEFETDVAIRPRATAYKNLGLARVRLGQASEALAAYEKALELAPDDVDTLLLVSWARATSPDASIADAGKALRFAERAHALRPDDATVASARAAALAASGDFTRAAAQARIAHDAAQRAGQSALSEHARLQAEAYDARRIYRP